MSKNKIKKQEEPVEIKPIIEGEDILAPDFEVKLVGYHPVTGEAIYE